jgi:biotin carboxyl carrier protein
MAEATVNQTNTFEIIHKNGQYLLNGEVIQLDIHNENAYQTHILHENHSYNVSIHKIDTENNEVSLTINGKKAVVKLRSQTELLLKSLGLENALVTKIEVVKAPMPGLIHSILVEEGQEVQKGDPLLILEAMKMENIIKAPGDGTIAKIQAVLRASVDKNEVLIRFK